MVDFSLTDGDIRLMDLTQRDYEITRRYAREVDRTTENETNLRSGDHPISRIHHLPTRYFYKRDRGSVAI